MEYQNQGNQGSDFVKGALLGGILGGAAGLLVAPKSGEELQEDIIEGYNSISEKAQHFSDTMQDAGQSMLRPFQQKPKEGFFNGQSSFLIGGATGAVVGAVVALLLAPKSGKELRDDLGENYEGIRRKAEEVLTDLNSKRQDAVEELGDWQETLTKIVGKLTNAKRKKGEHSPVNDIVEWAGLGINLLQQLQKRR